MAASFAKPKLRESGGDIKKLEKDREKRAS